MVSTTREQVGRGPVQPAFALTELAVRGATQLYGLQMSALSRDLLVSNGNVTVVVRQLQEQGLVLSQANPRDGRSAIVSLTPAGKTRFIELAEAHHRWIAELFVDVSEEEKTALATLLGNLRSVLGKNR